MSAGAAAPGGPRARYLLFSVDAEPDDPDWQGLGPGPWSHGNFRGLPALQARLKALGAKATYFASHSSMEAGGLDRILQAELAAGTAEVGAHFHPGDTPPFRPLAPIATSSTAAGRAGGDNVLDLPDGLLEEKFASLHAALSARCGTPRVHRAGAWALDARLAAILRARGYAADSSATPGVSWKRNRRPSYLGAPMRAYRLGEGDPAQPGATGPWEIPVSIWSPRRWHGTWAGRAFGDLLTMPLAARGGAAAALVRALRPPAPRWLRPAFAEAGEMAATAERLEAEGAAYLHVMCHSNELWPGASPYARHASDVERFFARLEGILGWALKRGYTPVTVGGYAGILEAAAAPGPEAASGRLAQDREQA